MFTRENIVFEENNWLIDRFCKNKEQIIDSIYILTINLINELNIYSLQKITIRNINPFEQKLGIAISSNKQSVITLGYITAVNLDKDSEYYTEDKYMNALATFRHEFYHVFDYENIVLRQLSKFNFNNSVKNTIENGFKIWTEFFATYSTFDTCEQPHIYDDFESSFNPYKLKANEIIYTTSRILGYYFREHHKEKCDSLVEKHLNSKCLAETCEYLQGMLNRYPCILPVDLIRLKKLFNGFVPLSAQ